MLVQMKFGETFSFWKQMFVIPRTTKQMRSLNRANRRACVRVATPAECTMHLGAPVVPEEYMMNRGWEKGSCSNSS